MSEQKEIVVEAESASVKKTEPVNQPAPVAKKAVELAVSESGTFVAKTFEEQFKIASVFRQSGILPERYKTTEMVMAAMQLCYELGLKPLTAMRQIAVIHGTPSLYGDLPLALVMASKKCEQFEEFYVDKNSNPINTANKNLAEPAFAAVTICKRVGQPVREFHFTIQDAKNAQLYQNTPTWKKYERIMLKYRARSQALKDTFADVLNGIGISEYDHNLTGEFVEEASDKPSAAQSINERYGKKPAVIDANVKSTNNGATINEQPPAYTEALKPVDESKAEESPKNAEAESHVEEGGFSDYVPGQPVMP